MKAVDVLLYTVTTIVLFVLYTVVVPYLISAKSTPMVIAGFAIAIGTAFTTGVYVYNNLFKSLFEEKKEKE